MQPTKAEEKKAGARSIAPSSSAPQIIDLPTALRLAGAQNLDVQIARQRLGEARANHAMVREQFFPWLMPGFTYSRDDGQLQETSGNIVNVSRQSYSLGANVAAELELGETYFKELASRQLVRAADHNLQAEQQQSVFTAGAQYFELARARAAVEVAREAIRISTDYEQQLQQVVEVGRAFKGDLLRVKVQTGHDQLALRRALEQQRLAAARLAQTLRLDATVELVAADTDPLPLTLVATNQALDSLVAQALNARPELRQSQALVAAARREKQGVTYGPLVPTVGAQMFFGGLGGGFNSDFGNFGDREHYQLLLGWRLGPGGLFDKPRIEASAARLEGARLQTEKLKDEIVRQVVEAFTRSQSLRDQLATTLRTLSAAEETLRLSRERKEFGVGIVLEYIQAGQELTRARNDYLTTVAEHNQAQFSLYTALGQPASAALSQAKPLTAPVPPAK
ncbi:MAG: TolC family protein [Pedosphaera parvula]|nr:TolC family protein [Pedosphaera parvula]